MTQGTTGQFQKDTLRFGLLGFFATLAGLSLLLNGYLLWVLNQPRVEHVSGGRTPAPVTAADHARGPSDAFVTVIVYSDFECAFCRELHASLKTLASERRFRWVLRHYPVTTHPNAARYAEACECAGRQGKFWEFADWLFEALAPQRVPVQEPLPPGAAAPLQRPEELSVVRLVETAHVMGLDASRFRECLERQQESGRVLAQKAEGESLAITATPTFFINGKRFVGALLPDELRKIVGGDSARQATD